MFWRVDTTCWATQSLLWTGQSLWTIKIYRGSSSLIMEHSWNRMICFARQALLESWYMRALSCARICLKRRRNNAPSGYLLFLTYRITRTRLWAGFLPSQAYQLRKESALPWLLSSSRTLTSYSWTSQRVASIQKTHTRWSVCWRDRLRYAGPRSCAPCTSRHHNFSSYLIEWYASQRGMLSTKAV